MSAGESLVVSESLDLNLLAPWICFLKTGTLDSADNPNVTSETRGRILGIAIQRDYNLPRFRRKLPEGGVTAEVKVHAGHVHVVNETQSHTESREPCDVRLQLGVCVQLRVGN